MGTCCSKIENPNEATSFNSALHSSLEQWQAARSSCQLCRANEFASHLQCCTCDSCERAASDGIKGLFNMHSYREPMCSLCVADLYDSQLYHQQAPFVTSRLTGGSDEDESADLMRSNCATEHALEKSHSLGEHAIMHGNLVDVVNKQELSKDMRASDRDILLMDHSCNLIEHKDWMHSSGTLTSCTKEEHDALLSDVAACEIMGNSRRLSSIDDSDGIKLEVRYKHMLPQDAHFMTCNHTSPHDANVLKRARPQEERLLTVDPEANRSTRRRKSFQITGFDDEEEAFERCLLSSDCDDEDFHDITVGVSIGSFDVERDRHSGAEQSLDALSLSDCDVGIRDLQGFQAQDGLQCQPDCVGLEGSDLAEMDRPMYVMSQENLQFISRKEREWEERAHGMGMAEENIGSKMQSLSVVSTGDAILFSGGGNSGELHLIPSVAVVHHHSKSPFSSPPNYLSTSRTVSPEKPNKQVAKRSPSLSIDEIVHLLEIDELNEDELFSLLIESCTKSSASSSPSSLADSTNSWSSPLSSSSSSSSTSSTSLSSMPSSSPLSSTSVLQLPPSSATTYSSTLPYSLSLPPSCKMSPHTSFEFTVKSCGSIPSTPVFSPIRSRGGKQNNTHLKPSTLTASEIADIWGVFEQRQAFISQQHMLK